MGAKRILAIFLGLLMLWPTVGISVSAEEAAFTPTDSPEGLYKCCNPSWDGGRSRIMRVTVQVPMWSFQRRYKIRPLKIWRCI